MVVEDGHSLLGYPFAIALHVLLLELSCEVMQVLVVRENSSVGLSMFDEEMPNSSKGVRFSYLTRQLLPNSNAPFKQGRRIPLRRKAPWALCCQPSVLRWVEASGGCSNVGEWMFAGKILQSPLATAFVVMFVAISLEFTLRFVCVFIFSLWK